MNINALRHPRTLWSIEAAMWRAIELSLSSPDMQGLAFVRSAKGQLIMTVLHWRDRPGAFRFYMDCTGVTDAVTKLLRETASEIPRRMR